MTHRSTVAALVLALLASPALAASFDVIGSNVQFIPRAISADGSSLIGSGIVSFPGKDIMWPMAWTRSTDLNHIGTPDPAIKYNIPTAVSADGNTLTGYFQDEIGTRTAYRYTPATGYQPLAAGINTLVTESDPRSMSADGSVIAGQASFDFGRRGFRWTASTGMLPLPDLPKFITDDAKVISADGRTIAGVNNAYPGSPAFIWTANSGYQPLSLPGYPNVHPAAISADGSVIAGLAVRSLDGGVVFRATPTGVVSLGLPPGAGSAFVMGANADGTILVGNAFEPDPSHASHPFIWTPAEGFLSVTDLLSQNGINLAHYTLTDVSGISADGSTIFGRCLIDGIAGPHPAAWVADISGLISVPEPSALSLLLLLSTPALLRRRR